MSLDSVWHQVAAQRRLQLALQSRRAPHAYLFSGPEGVGKEMLAVAFAQVLLCPASRARPVAGDERSRAIFGDLDSCFDACNSCTDCELVRSANHPDLHVIHRELIRYHPNPEIRKRKALALSVDVIREFLIGPAGTRPSRGRAKVFVVRESELLSDAAQNALLKTLEEPPPDTYLILLTVSAERMLGTTRSRTQPVSFSALPIPFVRTRLRESMPELEESQACFLASVNAGRLGPAVQSARNRLHEIKRPVVSATVELRPGGVIAWAKQVDDAAAQLAEQSAETRSDASDTELKRSALRKLLETVSFAFDDALRILAGTADLSHPPAHADQPEVPSRLADRLDTDAAGRAIRCVAAAQSNLDRNVNATLALEALATELSGCLSAAGAR